jgi:hypothetical protein
MAINAAFPVVDLVIKGTWELVNAHRYEGCHFDPFSNRLVSPYTARNIHHG